MKWLYITAKQRRPSFFILYYSILKCNNTYRDHYKQTAKLYKSILIILNYGTKMRKYFEMNRSEAGERRDLRGGKQTKPSVPPMDIAGYHNILSHY